MNEFRIKAIVFEQATKLNRSTQILCTVELVQGVYQIRIRNKMKPSMTTHFIAKADLDQMLVPEEFVARVTYEMLEALFKGGN